MWFVVMVCSMDQLQCWYLCPLQLSHFRELGGDAMGTKCWNDVSNVHLGHLSHVAINVIVVRVSTKEFTTSMSIWKNINKH